MSNDSDVHGDHTFSNGLPAIITFDMWLVKTDLSGVIQWQKCLGGSGLEIPECLINTSDGGFIVCGETNSHDGDVTERYTDSITVNYATGNRQPKIEGWVVKLDSTGVIEWASSIGSHTGEEYLSSICEVADGFVAVGWTNAQEEDWQIHVLDPTDSVYNFGRPDALVVKLNFKGEQQYHRLLGGTKGDGAYSVVPASDGYCFVGATASNDYDVSGIHSPYYGDIWVVRLDDAGHIRWQKCFGGSKAEDANCIINTPTGYMIAGWTMSTDGDVTANHGGRHPWIFSIDTNGALLNQRCFGGSNDTDNIYSIIRAQDGNYVFAGSVLSNDGDVSGLHRGASGSPDSTDGWIGEFTPDFKLLWQKCLGGTSNDGFGSVIETSDGGFLLNGITESNDDDVSGNHPGKGYSNAPNRVSDVWNVKLASPYATVAVASASKQFDLYPNPATSLLHAGEGFAAPRLFDALGRAYTVPNHDGTLDISSIPAGVYYVSDGKQRARFVKE